MFGTVADSTPFDFWALQETHLYTLSDFGIKDRGGGGSEVGECNGKRGACGGGAVSR